MAKRIHYNLAIVILVIIAFIGFTHFQKTTEPQSVNIDLNNDSIDETIKLENGIAYVYKEDKIIFESEPDWDVKEILAGDFNNDGQNDFALSLWKDGNYGESKPFWIEENDNSYKMHLFIYTWKRDKIAALWHSSNLPKENIKTNLLDIESDGKNELVVFEKSYTDNKYSIASWQWNEWGFELKKRLQFY
jgi:hypothetical protein